MLIGVDSCGCGKRSRVKNKALLQQKPLGIRAAPNSCGRPGAEAAGPTAVGCSVWEDVRADFHKHHSGQWLPCSRSQAGSICLFWFLYMLCKKCKKKKKKLLRDWLGNTCLSVTWIAAYTCGLPSPRQPAESALAEVPPAGVVKQLRTWFSCREDFENCGYWCVTSRGLQLLGQIQLSESFSKYGRPAHCLQRFWFSMSCTWASVFF